MRTSCLINNYNYEKYIIIAIESAINQTVPFDEIVVVDDGSTDNSLSIIKEKFDANEKIKIVAKQNQGQLSGFNDGFLASSGDIIFFLDADDVYEPNYLEEALNFYDNNRECDFLFCALTEFGQKNKISRQYSTDKKLGFTRVLTMYLRKWVGAPTSAISIRRDILEKILPMPAEYLSDWRVRADDCLVWGASLAGAYKCYLNRPLVRYRVHGNNNFTGKKLDYKYRYNRVIAVSRFFHYLKKKYYGNDIDFELYELAKAEFRTVFKPNIKDLFNYISIVTMSNMTLSKKMEMAMSILGSYINQNKKYN